MIHYPPPSGDILTNKQKVVIQKMNSFLSGNHFDQRKIFPKLPDLVMEMGAVSDSLEDQGRMLDELDRIVRWHRLNGYWLAYLFQLAMQKAKSPYFVAACRLYSDAQINLNHDLSLSSLENAYNALVQWREINENDLIKSLCNDYLKRMRIMYEYYRKWYASCPYSEINPLTEHIYWVKTHYDLATAFPILKKHREDLSSTDYQEIIQDSIKNRDIYSCVLARRFMGAQHEGRQEWDVALEQYRTGLREALGASLDTEIGHFCRLYGYALTKTGQLQEAASLFEKALNFESHPEFSFWSSLSARELGDVRLKMAPRSIDPSNPPLELKQAMQAYKAGRIMFEAHIGMGIVPAARAVKQQLFRSFTDNALQVAQLEKNTLETLAELEAAGPRYATEIVAESNAAKGLPPEDQMKFRHSRAFFHQHLNAFNPSEKIEEGFSRYTNFVQEHRQDRLFYMKTRNALTVPISFAQISDDIAKKVAALRLPNVVFLLFHVGQEKTFAAFLDCESGQMATGVTAIGERHLRSYHESYYSGLLEAECLPDPSIGMIPVLDDLLGHYESFMSLLLEPFLPFLQGKHLKIFPRLFMNEVPLHALKLCGKRLIEYCQVSYAQTLGLFLQVHHGSSDQDQLRDHGGKVLMVCDEKGAPLYEGAIRQLKGIYKDDLCLLSNASWHDFADSMRNQSPADVFFACHGLYNPDDPSTGSLFFSESESIPFSKIFSELEPSNCRSITLGACESGLGRSLVTAEYLGLPIAFFATGIRYVIGSLWKINQLSAAILLSNMFENLHEKHLSVPNALNEAQRFLMKMPKSRVLIWIKENLPDRFEKWEPFIASKKDQPFMHPYYWAGFYVAGDV